MCSKQMKLEVQKITKLNKCKCFRCGNSFQSHQHLQNHKQYDKSCKSQKLRALSGERSRQESDFGHFTGDDYSTAAAEDAVFYLSKDMTTIIPFISLLLICASVNSSLPRFPMIYTPIKLLCQLMVPPEENLQSRP